MEIAKTENGGFRLLQPSRQNTGPFVPCSPPEALHLSLAELNEDGQFHIRLGVRSTQGTGGSDCLQEGRQQRGKNPSAVFSPDG